MEHIAQLLVAENVVRVNFTEPFTWTSGIKSPIYCDCRELISAPRARDQIIEAFLQHLKTADIPCQYIAGPETAGIPWAAFIADRLKIPMLYVRKKPKGHGTGKMVEGKVRTGNPKIVVVEDAFSTAGSSIVSAEALRAELGAEVNHILGIFSWSTPQATANAQAAAVQLAPLTNFKEIVTALLEAEKITQEEYVSLERFHADPAGWWN